MGDLLKFTPPPKKKKQLVLQDNIDIAFCLWAVNMFGVQHMEDGQIQTIGPNDLGTLRIDFVLECLKQAAENEYFTDKGKAFITSMITVD